MQRRHFQLIADALKDTRPHDLGMSRPTTPEAQWRRTCEVIANHLRSTNPAFNKGRFLAACGVED